MGGKGGGVGDQESDALSSQEGRNRWEGVGGEKEWEASSSQDGRNSTSFPKGESCFCHSCHFCNISIFVAFVVSIGLHLIHTAE